jgi:hypothetical protein
MIRYLLVLWLLMLLSGCAVMDLSTLDTAVPVAPAKVQVAPYQAIGLDMSSVVYNDEAQDDDEHFASVDLATGIKANISVREDMDLQLRGYIGTGKSRGAKLGIKKLVLHKGNHYMAIAPAFNWISDKPSDSEESDYKAFGIELQLLNTYHIGGVSITMVARGNYSRLMLDRSIYGSISGTDIREYDIVHGGLRANLCLKAKHLYIIPEIGFEFVPVINGKLSMIPTLGWTIGLEL